MLQFSAANGSGIKISAALILALVLFASGSRAVESPNKTISFTAMPEKFQLAVKAKINGGTVTRAEEAVDHGETNYVLLVKRAAGEREFTFAEDGDLISAQVLEAELPKAVRQILAADFKSFKPAKILRVTEDDEPIFEFAFGSNSTNNLYIEENGKWWSLEISEAETPAPVLAAIKKELGAGNHRSISKTKDSGEIFYEIEATTKDNRDVALEIMPNGTLQSRKEEIPLSQVTAEALKTIRARVGEGKVLSVSKRTEDGGVVFDVEAERDGKPVKFTVGPQGKIRKD